MKKLIALIGLAALAGVTLTTGCAHVVKTSSVGHELVRYGVALPPDWKAVVPSGGLTLPQAEQYAYADFSFAGETNTANGLLANSPKVFVAYRESWTDYSRGGGTFLFTDPQASQIQSVVSNQAALAGSHQFQVGSVSSTITSNAVSAITAGASGVGNIIGAAAKAASGTP